MSIQKRLRQEFYGIFSADPEIIIRAPGRVNLIGEHTDYNDGFVLPMAIDQAIWMAVRARQDRKVVSYSLDFGEISDFSLDDIQKESHTWKEYLKGVAWLLQQEGYSLKGWEGMLAGDVPIGSGLSSSAALEMATLRSFSEISDFTWDAKSMAIIGQRVEMEWIGVQSGIMDQLISALGKAGHALLMDCRTLETEYIPLPEGITFIVIDTGVRRDLVHSAYNLRRSQCRAAANRCKVPALRDLTMDTLQEMASELEPILYQRANHVVSENQRTLQAAKALRLGDIAQFGGYMNASHASLRDDYEVSCKELDYLVEISLEEGAIGARMTGAGFGGCVVSVVREGVEEVFSREVMERYREKTGLEPKAYPCAASDGISVYP